MAKNISELVGKKVFLDRILDDFELRCWNDFNLENDDNIKNILETGKERKEGIFRRTMVVGEYDFVEPIYHVENLKDFLSSSGQDILQYNHVENPVLNIYHDIDEDSLDYVGNSDNIPVFEIYLLRYGAEFITDKDSVYEEIMSELNLAGF